MITVAYHINGLQRECFCSSDYSGSSVEQFLSGRRPYNGRIRTICGKNGLRSRLLDIFDYDYVTDNLPLRTKCLMWMQKSRNMTIDRTIRAVRGQRDPSFKIHFHLAMSPTFHSPRALSMQGIIRHANLFEGLGLVFDACKIN